MNHYLEQIHKTVSLQDLKDHMFAILSLMESVSGASPKKAANLKLIRTITDVIDKEYDQDLSLEGIAERVYLTPSYLSYLFKKRRRARVSSVTSRR
ncbi:hypothetical protein ACFSQ7_34725 [Paenibacillus rhizoplanae]